MSAVALAGAGTYKRHKAAIIFLRGGSAAFNI